jgi:hypothetical protein
MYDAGLICFGMIKIILPAGFAVEFANKTGRATKPGLLPQNTGSLWI